MKTEERGDERRKEGNHGMAQLRRGLETAPQMLWRKSLAREVNKFSGLEIAWIKFALNAPILH